MTGILFGYEPGHIEATFTQDPCWDRIHLHVNIISDITTTTEVEADAIKID